MEENFSNWQDQKRDMIKKLAEKYPNLKANSGIYMFYRVTAYIGKSAEKDGILGRCASHCVSHQQHIDNSIHSRKLSCDGGQWFIKPLIYCKPSEVDMFERMFIDKYNGIYELYNTESGGTEGKTIIGQRKEAKGYSSGLALGYQRAIKEVRTFFTKYLDYVPKNQNKITLRKLEQFKELTKGDKL